MKNFRIVSKNTSLDFMYVYIQIAKCARISFERKENLQLNAIIYSNTLHKLFSNVEGHKFGAIRLISVNFFELT